MNTDMQLHARRWKLCCIIGIAVNRNVVISQIVSSVPFQIAHLVRVFDPPDPDMRIEVSVKESDTRNVISHHRRKLFLVANILVRVGPPPRFIS